MTPTLARVRVRRLTGGPGTSGCSEQPRDEAEFDAKALFGLERNDPGSSMEENRE